MLTMTDNAVVAIRNITAAQEIPDGAGVRIATDADAGALTITLAPEPTDGDQVVDREGARLFVDEQAVPMLDDKSLDATVDGQGGVQFSVAQQV